MATISLVALRTFPYADQAVVAGQCFVAMSEADAVLLKTVGYAVDAPADRVDVVTVSADAETVDEPPKRRYRRRDLTADAE